MLIVLKRGQIELPLAIFSLVLWISILVLCKGVDSNAWERPGCYRLGHTRQIRIPGCVPFVVPTNACRGYCTSFAIPSTEDSLLKNRRQVITSIAECCTILDTEDVVADVRCIDGLRSYVFKSATKCGCYQCNNKA